MSTSDKPPSHLVFYLMQQQIERKKPHYFAFYESGKTGFLCLL
jgi:hypothetical protein